MAVHLPLKKYTILILYNICAKNAIALRQFFSFFADVHKNNKFKLSSGDVGNTPAGDDNVFTKNT